MTQVMDKTADKQVHLSNFDRFAQGDGAAVAVQPWVEGLRRRAITRFDQVGFPSRKEEAWRFTNLDPIVRTPFKLGDLEGPDNGALAAEQYTFGREAAVELVFVNGQYVSRLSRHGKLPRGTKVTSLAQALESDGELIAQHLAKYASIEAHPFVALNTGFVSDGAYLRLPRNATIEEAIHLIFVSTGGHEPTVSHPRVLVIAEENVEATVVESYVGSGSGVYFTNAVTEFVTGADCRIDHCKLQQESLAAYHVATMQVDLGRASRFISHAATVGGRLTRNDLNVKMNGEYADATLNGLVIIGGEQHCDNHTLLHHEKPNCPSHELYKHVLDGRATGVFKGKIFVQKDAQKTDSKQTSKTLLLSDDAYMNSQPALEIYADDVKCTHGSTTGPVDEEAVFYLRSRGVSLEAARHLMSYAFAADITRRIRVAPVRRRLEDFMAAQHGLPQDLRITDLGSHDEKAR
jgi:Fe-S cluster assembly protein SufD